VDKPPGSNKKHENEYLKYSGMAFQMAATIFVGILLGQWLDRRLQTAKPYCTMIAAVIFSLAAIYVGIKDFLVKPK
jgi:F0F1-type ATP synthase assembly protein I